MNLKNIYLTTNAKKVSYILNKNLNFRFQISYEEDQEGSAKIATYRQRITRALYLQFLFRLPSFFIRRTSYAFIEITEKKDNTRIDP
jgi:hypothetical protein